MSTTITVPATTANIGPGFDCLGAALTLNNRFSFSVTNSDNVEIAVNGVEAENIQTSQDNLAYRAFVKFYEHLQQTPPTIRLDIQLGFPLSRGLGSSATAIVGGLMGANELAGQPLSTAQLMQLAIAIEGHPDNVVPALLGGCRLVAGSGEDWDVCDVRWHPQIVPVLAIPNFEVSTKEAREVLPSQYRREDAIFNTSRLGMLIRGLETANKSWLSLGMRDRLHQPYRQSLIPGYQDVREAAIAAGAYGLAISGAGPTLLALSAPNHSADIAVAMTSAWQKHNINAQVKVLGIDPQGALAKSN
ncbi:homoserine kinase [Geitlerinema sp. PCC 9228]|uniref:homoserine kinase n=1 Tax=Geitlerinema sp. PCC 9228 TaxID=111611 RepID=UPI0008F9CC0B|nr:homoserine kinase [Geitlerinema sp. PCC 9228]